LLVNATPAFKGEAIKTTRGGRKKDSQSRREKRKNTNPKNPPGVEEENRERGEQPACDKKPGKKKRGPEGARKKTRRAFVRLLRNSVNMRG